MKAQNKEYRYEEEGIEFPQELIFVDVFKILSEMQNCCIVVCGQYNNGRVRWDDDGIK